METDRDPAVGINALPAGQAGTPSELDRLRQRLASLKECFRISSLINSSLELEEVLENIMTTSRSILKADACSLMLVDEKTGELVFEVAQGPVAHKLKGGMRIKKGQGIAGQVFETGEPTLIEDAYCDPRFNQEVDRMTGYRTRSILCVPLKIQDRVIGVSQIINKLDGTSFNAEDEETLGLLCASAATAIENARLHREILRKQQIERDLAFASSIQLSFLPQRMPIFEGFRFEAYYEAAQEVGGDFYDFIPLVDGRIGVLIGDVSGKGIASALFMARLTTDFRLLALQEKDPERLISRINKMIFEQSCRGMFVTLLYMILTSGSNEVVYINAGHLPPVLWNHCEDKPAILHGRGGPPLGILAERQFALERIPLRPCDCILLATDGLVEAKNEQGERFGWERLVDTMKAGKSDIESVKYRIGRSIDEFVGGCPRADDTTIVLVGVEER
jgi:sigma-B regulation protein RsbU (phosphoserine phosphatase)